MSANDLYKDKIVVNVDLKHLIFLQVIHWDVRNVAVTLLGLLVASKYVMKRLGSVYAKNE